MADALSKNLTRMSACRVFKSLDLKNSNSFELHVLDTEQQWLDLVCQRFKEHSLNCEN